MLRLQTLLRDGGSVCDSVLKYPDKTVILRHAWTDIQCFKDTTCMNYRSPTLRGASTVRIKEVLLRNAYEKWSSRRSWQHEKQHLSIARICARLFTGINAIALRNKMPGTWERVKLIVIQRTSKQKLTYVGTEKRLNWAPTISHFPQECVGGAQDTYHNELTGGKED